MTQKRAAEIFSDFGNALARLKEALREDPSKSGTVVDGTIQRFEFTFELAWKLAKAILSEKGITVTTPRDAVKEAFRAGIIADGDSWVDMLMDRNKTSHIYDEAEALEIYNKIKVNYLKLFIDFQGVAEVQVKG